MVDRLTNRFVVQRGVDAPKALLPASKRHPPGGCAYIIIRWDEVLFPIASRSLVTVMYRYGLTTNFIDIV